MDLTKRQQLLDELHSSSISNRNQAALKIWRFGADHEARQLCLLIQKEQNIPSKRLLIHSLGLFRKKSVASQWIASLVAISDDETILYYGLDKLRQLKSKKYKWLALAVSKSELMSVKFASLVYLYACFGLDSEAEKLLQQFESATTGFDDWYIDDMGPGVFYKGRIKVHQVLSAIRESKNIQFIDDDD